MAAAERIVRAVEALAAAKVERDQALTDALKAGASVREVAAVSGMSERQVQTIGHNNGWPSPAQKKRWADEKAYRDAWASWSSGAGTPMPKPADFDLPDQP